MTGQQIPYNLYRLEIVEHTAGEYEDTQPEGEAQEGHDKGPFSDLGSRSGEIISKAEDSRTKKKIKISHGPLFHLL